MSYQAIFIGGAFDMTKRTITRQEPTVSFFEPIQPALVASVPKVEEHVPCRQLIYKLVYITPQGTLVYELDSFEA